MISSPSAFPVPYICIAHQLFTKEQVAAIMPVSTQCSDLCSMCPRTAASFCQKCHCSRCCSQDCQLSDWRTHKLVCDSFKVISQAPPPHPDSYRVIFFDTQKSKPEWVWIHMTPRPGTDDFGIKIQSLPQDQAKLLRNIAHTKHNYVLGRDHSSNQWMGCMQSASNMLGRLYLGGVPNPNAAAIAPELLNSVKGPLLFTG
jgi:hypothetical protein